MAKQLLTYNPFNGGLNTKDDPKDISKEELADVSNYMVDSIGKMRTIGGLSAVGADITLGEAATMQPGHGIGTFSSGYAFSNNFVLTKGGSDFIVWVRGDTSGIYIYNGAAWKTDSGGSPTTQIGRLSTGSGTHTAKGVFYDADGAIRIADGSVVEGNNAASAPYSTHYSKWLGPIDRTYFTGTGSFTISKWLLDNNVTSRPMQGVYSGGLKGTLGATVSTTVATATVTSTNAKAELGTPTRGWGTPLEYHLVQETAGAGTVQARDITNAGATTVTTDAGTSSWITGQTYKIYPPPGQGFNINIETTGSDGLWEDGSYKLAASYIYNFKDESRLTELKGDALTISDDLYFKVMVLASSNSSNSTFQYNNRVTGGRIYIKRKNDADAKWKLLVDLDFEQGSRISTFNAYNSWGYVAVGDVETANDRYYYTQEYSIKNPPFETYEGLTGFSEKEGSLSFGWGGWSYKTALTANQRAFVANVTRKDEDGILRVMAGRIHYTPVGAYDTFPASYYIDLGGEITIEHMVEFGDRLLIFDKKRVLVLNIGSPNDGGWFKEGQFENMGILSSSSVFKTQIGVVWANQHGCFYYNGSGPPKDLTDKIDDATWSTFAGGENMITGYIPLKNQVVILKDGNFTTATDTYLYDFRTSSWTKGAPSTIGSDYKITNFISYYQGNVENLTTLLYTNSGSNPNILTRKWSDTSADQSGYFVLKDEDFGQPALRKKIYRVVVTYRNTSAALDSVQLGYRKDGLGGSFQDFGSAVNLYKTTAQNWKVAHFSPPAGLSTGVNSIQFKLPSTKNVEINDLTVEFRVIKKRAEAASGDD